MKHDSSRDLDWNVIKDDLLSILVATTNKIEREWPSRYSNIDSAREIVLLTVKLAINTFCTVLYLCAEKPEDFRRERTFCLSVPPLSRTILEGLLTLLFLLEDLPAHSAWFWKTSYREWVEELEKYELEYGTLSEWQPFIAKLKSFVRNPPSFIGLTEEDIGNPKKRIPFWPNPGRMPRVLRQENAESDTISWMEYLNDWYYGSLSGQTHLNMHGLLERGHFLSPRETLERVHGDKAAQVLKQLFDNFRNDQVWTAIVMILALVSEIELHFHFELKERLKYLWTVIAGSSDYAKGVYDRRYSNL